MAGAHSREFGSQDFYGGRGSIQGFSAGIVALFHPSIPTFFRGFFWGFGVVFFLCFPGKSSDPLRRIARNSKGMELGVDWERLRPWIWENPGWDLGSRLEFGMEESGMESGIQAGIWDGRIRDGIWDPGRNLEESGLESGIWDGRIRDSGSRPEFGMEESGLESGLQAGIWAGIPGMWSRSNTPESPKSLGIETIPSRPSGTIQRLRIPGKLGKSQERTSLTPKFHLLFQEEPIPAEIPEFGAVSPPPAEKSAGIFPGDPKKFPAPTLVGLPPPLFPANPDPSSEFRAGNGQNSAGAGSRTSGRAGHGSRSEFPEFGTGIESRTLALPPNLFPVFFLLVVFFNGSNFGIPGMPSGGGGGGGGRKSGIPGNFGVGFSSWKTPG
ncbi:uncharacterized protein LOC125317948 isoform X3 [Corvus hawaiiensis]|uniref:uncharacterized protein LOC125317948 isoform X3 n=1 Tax=Corvus hawaiiensis TaxID=134902 RepID=UPI0020188910|nr:uncharacterized protein LOC125317948 isoform X3 [Corvus hawaiiensis]